MPKQQLQAIEKTHLVRETHVIQLLDFGGVFGT